MNYVKPKKSTIRKGVMNRAHKYVLSIGGKILKFNWNKEGKCHYLTSTGNKETLNL